jgi:hypothetical protein
MNKQEILETLSNCIELVKLRENVYLRNRLTEVADALIKEWYESEMYHEQIKQILHHDETYENLNNLKIR